MFNWKTLTQQVMIRGTKKNKKNYDYYTQKFNKV